MKYRYCYKCSHIRIGLHLIFVAVVFVLMMPISCIREKEENNTLPIQRLNTYILENEDPRLFLEKNIEFGGTLKLSYSNDPTSFSMYGSFSQINEILSQYILLPLLERNPIDQKIRSGLALKWSYHNDNLTIKFELRNSHYWSDGIPITADDVAFTFNEILLNPLSPSHYLEVFSHKGQSVTLEILDQKTILFHLPIPLPDIIYALTYLPILPSHKITKEQVSPQKLFSLWPISSSPDSIVSSGPFVFSSYDYKNSVFTFRRNPFFFRGDTQGNQLPYIDTLKIFIIPHSSQRLTQFVSSKMDIYQPSPSEFDLLTKRKKKKLSKTNYELFESIPVTSSVTHIGFNFDVKNLRKSHLFKNKSFRVAVSHLIDRDHIIQLAYKNKASSLGLFVSPYSPYYYPTEVYNPFSRYDPLLAAELLDSLGICDYDGDGWRDFSDKSSLKLNIIAPLGTTTNYEMTIARILTMAFEEVGIKSTLDSYDRTTFMSKLRTNNFEIVVRRLSNSLYPGVRTRVIWQPGQFMYYFHYKIFDKNDKKFVYSEMFEWEKVLNLLYEIAKTSGSEFVRQSHYKRIQEIYATELPVIFIARQHELYAVNNRVSNISINEDNIFLFTPWTLLLKDNMST